jgi:uncharacterized protein YecT (DUF1311 family)
MRTTVVGIVTAVFLAAAPEVIAAPAAKPRPSDCFDTAVIQPEINACAASKAAAADRRLNAAYREIMRFLEKEEQAELVKAQRAWIAFRDADCAFFSAGGGSIAPMNDAQCRADLSEFRAKELENWPPNSDRGALAPLR